MLLEAWALLILCFCNTLAFLNQQNLIIACPCTGRWRSSKRNLGWRHAPRSCLSLYLYCFALYPLSNHPKTTYNCQMRTRWSRYRKVLKQAVCFPSLGRSNSSSLTADSSLRNIKNGLMQDSWRLGVSWFEKGTRDTSNIPHPVSSSLIAHSSLRTTKMTTCWRYVELAGTNKTALSTIRCCQCLGLSILSLSSCITLTFICPTSRNEKSKASIRVSASTLSSGRKRNT